MLRSAETQSAHPPSRHAADRDAPSSAPTRPAPSPRLAQLSAFINSSPRPALRSSRALTPAAHSGQPPVQRVLSKDEFTQVQTLAQQIMERYPPAQYHYLGLGKSPTPVMAYLQAYGERQPGISATNMPLSKFGHRSDSMSAAERRVVDGAALNAEQRGRLWDHFDRFVPGPGALQGKSILLIDLVQTGKSLVATQRHLEEYLLQRSGGNSWLAYLCGCLPCCRPAPPPAVISLPLALAEQQVGGTKRTMDDLGLSARALMIPGSTEEPDSLAARMGGEKYKPIAEYPHDFKISAADRPASRDIQRDPRGDYATLQREFAAFMAEEAPVVRLLEGSHAIEMVERKEQETVRLLASSSEEV